MHCHHTQKMSHVSSCGCSDGQKYTDDSPSHNATLQIIHLNELPKAARVVVVCCFSIAKGLRRRGMHQICELFVKNQINVSD